MRFASLLTVVLFFSIASAHAESGVRSKRTSYGAKVEIDFYRDDRTEYPDAIFDIAYWRKDVACKYENDILVAYVNYSRHGDRMDTQQVRTQRLQTLATRTFKLLVGELCEQGTPKKVFVHGQQVY